MPVIPAPRQEDCLSLTSAWASQSRLPSEAVSKTKNKKIWGETQVRNRNLVFNLVGLYWWLIGSLLNPCHPVHFFLFIVRIEDCHWRLLVDGRTVYCDFLELALNGDSSSHAGDSMMRKVRAVSTRRGNRVQWLRLSPPPPPSFKLFFHLVSEMRSPEALASPEEVKRFWIIVKKNWRGWTNVNLAKYLSLTFYFIKKTCHYIL